MALIDPTSGKHPTVGTRQLIGGDRLGVILIFAGAIIFHLAVILNLLPST